MGFFKKDRKNELETQVSELLSENENLMSQIKDYQRTIHSFTGVKYEYEDSQKKLMESHSREISQLKQQMEIEKKSIARQINTKLAMIGVSTFVPEEISTEPKNMSQQNIFDKFENMVPGSKEQQEFYSKHEKTIDEFRKQFKK